MKRIDLVSKETGEVLASYVQDLKTKDDVQSAVTEIKRHKGDGDVFVDGRPFADHQAEEGGR